MTYFPCAFAEAPVQRAVQDQSTADTSSNEHAQNVACALCCAGPKLTIHCGVHIVLDDRWAAKLFSDARPKRKVFEFQIRRLDYVAGVEVDRAGSTDANCRD